MAGLGGSPLFAAMVRSALGDTHFTVLDIGCSGGINPAWRVFGESLRAIGIDPNLDEIARLTADEPSTAVTYLAGFVGLPSGEPGATRLATGEFWARNPADRLSVFRTLERRAASAVPLSGEEATRLNLWPKVRLADPKAPVLIPDLLNRYAIDDVDFIKIDVDGPDFLILRSLEPTLQSHNVLGVAAEVMFFGSDDPDIHTFHNVDRLMRKNGFDLFSLTTMPYSNAALPSRYVYTVPGLSEFGRPYWGDAIYLRDAAESENRAWSAELSGSKLLKLAALYAMAGVPDFAAEILVSFKDRVAAAIDVDAALDLLTATVRTGAMPETYGALMAAFMRDDPCFYPTPSLSEPTEPHPEPPPCPPPPAAAPSKPQEEAHDAQELDRLRNELHAVYGSTSWTVTAPLRWLGGRLRG